jgi:hypothetical protein
MSLLHLTTTRRPIRIQKNLWRSGSIRYGYVLGTSVYYGSGSGSRIFMFLGLPGSASGFVSHMYGFGSGSFHHQAKILIVRKTLNFTVLWLLYDFISLKNDVNVRVPDPLVRGRYGTDLRIPIRIRTKMSGIRNTARNLTLLLLTLIVSSPPSTSRVTVRSPFVFSTLEANTAWKMP